MDERALQLAEGFVSSRYIRAGVEALRTNERGIRSLLAQRRCPEEGLSDAHIELLLHQLALMDTNNFPHHIGGGEREGRVFSALVRRRCYGLTHGIGRSGDLTSEQPKAAGSSLLYKLTNAMLLDLVKLSGAVSTKAALAVPMATGMTLALALRCVARRRQIEEEKMGHSRHDNIPCPRIVIWPRIDQKTALKCIEATGLVAYPIELRPAPLRKGQEIKPADTHPYLLKVDVGDIAEAMDQLGGRDRVLCVLSTTSCFAPRLPDDVVGIARLCAERNIAHVVNNAYGLQSRNIMGRLEAAQRLGRVDMFVQSGDKNFLVPVGGAVLCSSDAPTVAQAAALYAGRASGAPIVDLFITALTLGRRGMKRLWEERYERWQEMAAALSVFALDRGEELIAEDVPLTVPVASSPLVSVVPRARNDISFAVTMKYYHEGLKSSARSTNASGETGDVIVVDSTAQQNAAAKAFGAKLFRSGVTGPRVVVPDPESVTTVAGCSFRSYGMHTSRPPCPMLVVACGLGMTKQEVNGLMRRLVELWPALPSTGISSS